MSDLFQNQQHHGKIIEEVHLLLIDLQNTRFEKCLFPNLTTLEVRNCPAELFVSCFFPELINLKVLNSNHRTFISCLFPKISNSFRPALSGRPDSPNHLSSPGYPGFSSSPGLSRIPSYPELSNSPRQNEKILDDFFSRVASKPIDPTKDVCSLIRSGENQEFRSGVPLTESQISSKLENLVSSNKKETDSDQDNQEDTDQFDLELDTQPILVPPISQVNQPIGQQVGQPIDQQVDQPVNKQPDQKNDSEQEPSMKGVLFFAGLFSGLGLALITRK